MRSSYQAKILLGAHLAKKTERSWWRRSRVIPGTVVAHLRGGGAGQGLKPTAFLAENLKGPVAGCPRRDGAFCPRPLSAQGPKG